jgi:hypothetical protein
MRWWGGRTSMVATTPTDWSNSLPPLKFLEDGSPQRALSLRKP